MRVGEKSEFFHSLTFCVLAMGGIISNKLQSKDTLSKKRNSSFEDKTPPIANTLLCNVFFNIGTSKSHL